MSLTENRKNMRNVLKIAGLVALLGAGVVAGAEPAAAQISVQIGSDRPRVERRIYSTPRVIERRVYRPAPRRTVCTTSWRTEITPRGIVRRPVERCRTRY
jgi:hypothetical protein